MRKLILSIELLGAIYIFCGCATIHTNTNPNYNFEFKNPPFNIAIFPEDDYNTSSKNISTELETEMLGLSTFNVISRREIDKIMKEHGLSLSGILKEYDYNKIGNISNIDWILLCSGETDMWGIYSKILIKIVDIKSGQVITGLSWDNRLWGGITSARKIARSIENAIINKSKQ